MATYSTGVTVSFASGSLTEVTAISWNFGGGIPIGRGVVFQPVYGQVSIESIGGASTATYGQLGSLAIAGGGVNLTCTAVCTDIGVTAEVNGVARYIYTFEILG